MLQIQKLRLEMVKTPEAMVNAAVVFDEIGCFPGDVFGGAAGWGEGLEFKRW
jgi:hypothetical protein